MLICQTYIIFIITSCCDKPAECLCGKNVNDHVDICNVYMYLCCKMFHFYFQIYVLLCQTDLVTLMKTDKMGLLLIRFASFNPILDPWVYILFRRELVWKIVNAIKCILRIEPKNIQNVKTPLNEEEPNCCMFCLQCLCEPPNTKTNYSVSRPSATLQRSPSERRRLSESLYGNGTVTSKLLIQTPSPADEMVLKSYRNAQARS